MREQEKQGAKNVRHCQIPTMHININPNEKKKKNTDDDDDTNAFYIIIIY
jgi:hypothetical protein